LSSGKTRDGANAIDVVVVVANAKVVLVFTAKMPLSLKQENDNNTINHTEMNRIWYVPKSTQSQSISNKYQSVGKITFIDTATLNLVPWGIKNKSWYQILRSPSQSLDKRN
jgi:hypothetical protein